MKLKKYSKYKDSGIDWIGEIPESWEVRKLKYINKLQGGYAFKSENFSEEGHNIIRIGDIQDNVNFNDAKKYPESIKIHRDFKIKNNDVLIALTGATIGKVGKVNNYSGKAYINQRVAKISGINNYYYYLLKSDFIKKQIELVSDGSAQENISNGQIEDFFIPFHNTQQKISSFLDSKTLQIEKLIEKDKNLIELLKEKRVSLINQSVTKGIEKNVKMKDSGVEWIGEIPEGWEIGPLKYYMNISGGYAFSSEDFSDYGIQLIRIGNLYLNNLDLNRQPIFLPNSFKKQHREFLIKKGDILLSLTGTLGKKDYGYAILVEGDEDYFLNQRVGRLNSKNNLLNYYAIYLLQSEFYLNQIYLLPSGSKQANLSNEQVLSPIVMIPSIQEQQKIVEFLDNETVRIDNHIKKVERRIELLEEYKKSLIYNVVTGKVEV